MNIYSWISHIQKLPKNYGLLLILFIILMALQGCGTLSDGQKWGHDATLTPGWDRIRTSAVNAALSPETWEPVAGALALQVGHMDRRISEWASDKNPVFGSLDNAEKWSDHLRDASGAVYFITVLATPSGDDAFDWLTSKAKGLAIGLVASEVTGGGTSLLKRAAGRTRPDGSNDVSFPSGHASSSAAFTTLARRNLEFIPMSQGSRLAADIGISGLSVGTGWARVEAKKHYPSDVLAGYALGHFVSAFINDAFLGLDNNKAPLITMEPSRKGVYVGLDWTF
jgi:membrane-associated phospholipid phosphatase